MTHLELPLESYSLEGADRLPADILNRYIPPFDLTAEMLFAASLCPTAWLTRSFPNKPFLSIWGRTPLVFWFSRINQIVYNAPDGGTDVLGSPNATLYNELNVMALLRRTAFFVPGIYATTELTLRIGRAYGMPKQMTEMSYERQGSVIESENLHGGRRSWVRATTGGNGRTLAALSRRILPLCIWEARFPEGAPLRPLLEEIPRFAPARIRHGQVWVNEAWMPEPLKLLPFGFHAQGLRMQLPPPKGEQR